MKKILLISEAQIKEQSVLDQNVNAKVLSNITKTVQELKLRPVLGPTLYAALLDAVAGKVTNSTPLSDLYKTMLEDYVQPFMVYATLADFHVLNNYKPTNKGVLKMNDNLAQNVSAQEVEYAKDYYDNYASQYKANLLSFLAANDLIEGSQDKDTTSSATGWYLEENDYKKKADSVYRVGEEDPVWLAEKANYYSRSEVDALVASVETGEADWNTLQNKPGTFTPSVHNHDERYYTETEVNTMLNGKSNTGHTHAYSSLTGLPTTFTPAAHTHAIAEITGLQTQLDGKAATGHTHAYSSLTGLPATFSPSAHTHAIADVTGLQSALDGKQSAGSYASAAHTHSITDVTGLQAALDAKQATLVSGISIKTINGNSLLGSGDITIAGGDASQWTSVGNHIYNSNTGNVLIGTATDAGYKLDINGTGRFSSRVTASNGIQIGQVSSWTANSRFSVHNVTAANQDYGAQIDLIAGVNSSKYGFGDMSIMLHNPNATVNNYKILYTFGAQGTYSDAGVLSGKSFYIYDVETTSYRMYIDSSGNMIIGGETGATAKLDVRGTLRAQGAATFNSTVTSTQFRLSALNTAPASATATGTLGEVRITNGFIYVCVATNTWQRSQLATW